MGPLTVRERFNTYFASSSGVLASSRRYVDGVMNAGGPRTDYSETNVMDVSF